MSGLPASGKSTVAKSLIKELYPNAVRLNKDLFRKMFFFSDWTWQNEKFVNEYEEVLAEQMLSEGRDVIIDDTNLTPYHENKWTEVAKRQNALFIKATQTTSWEECVDRDFDRENSVGEYVIKNMAMSLGQVKGDFVIVDLDGTLCDITDRRHFVTDDGNEKNWKAFFENIPGDKLRPEVAEIVKYLNRTGKKIVYMSGRPEEYKQQTLEWLMRNDMDFNFTLIMRKKGDRRHDVIVKREFLNKYFPNREQIIGVIDDRPAVVRMWKEELGSENVLDVGDGVEF